MTDQEVDVYKRQGMMYDSDNKTELGKSNISRKEFNVLIKKPANITQRMLDVAITAPENPLILYATFSTDRTDKNCVYNLYDTDKTIEICNGGNPLWNPKYQLGASFMGTDRIVVAREENDYDNIELYDYSQGQVTLKESVYSEEIGTIQIRNARPIVDVNQKAFLWHRGFYNSDTYTDFYIETKIYTMD